MQSVAGTLSASLPLPIGDGHAICLQAPVEASNKRGVASQARKSASGSRVLEHRAKVGVRGSQSLSRRDLFDHLWVMDVRTAEAFSADKLRLLFDYQDWAGEFHEGWIRGSMCGDS